MEKKYFSDSFMLAKLDAFLFLVFGVAMFLQSSAAAIAIYGFLVVLALVSFAKGFVREVMEQQPLGWVSRLISLGYFAMVIIVGWVITTNRPSSVGDESLFLSKVIGVSVLYLILTVASKGATMIVQILKKEPIGKSVYIAFALMVITMVFVDSYRKSFDDYMGFLSGVVSLATSFTLLVSSYAKREKLELVY